MELVQLKLNDIFNINVFDMDEILDTKEKTFKDFFVSKKINYKINYSENEVNQNNINFYIIAKNNYLKSFEDFCTNKNNVFLYYDIVKKKLEILDKINFKYKKISCFYNQDILIYLTDNFKFNLELINKSGKFSLPCGLLKSINVKLGLFTNYFLSNSKDHVYTIKFFNKKIPSIKIKSIKCNKLKYKYLNNTFFLLYFKFLKTMDNKYFIDSWFFSKYINHLKSVFKINIVQKEVQSILKKVFNFALQKRSSNSVYNKYKFFLENNKLYNSSLIDLYKFKSYCSEILNYQTKNEDDIEKLESSIPEKSLDFFTSKVSYSNWFDNIEIGSYFGLLINANYKRNCLEGTKPSIFIKNINQSVLAFDDYLENTKFYFAKYKQFDNGWQRKSLIDYDGIGKGNIFLPLFICPQHFNLVIKNIKITTGINIYQNPMKYTKNNLLVYISILSQLITETFCNPSYNSEKWFNIFFNYLIFVNKLINIFYSKSELIKLFSAELNSIKFNKDFVIGLYILLKINNNDTTVPDITVVIKKILEEEIRILCGKHCTTNINKVLPLFLKFNYVDYNLFLDKLDVSKFLNIRLIQNFQDMVENKLFFMKNIWSFFKFDVFINDYNSIYSTIVNNFGLLDQNYISKIRNIIINEKFPEENDTINGILNPIFEGHILYGKKKIINIMSIMNNILVFDKKFSDLNVKAMILQGLLQRNFNKRKIAIKNKDLNLYIDPNLYPNKCILNTFKIYIKLWARYNYSTLYPKINNYFKKTINIKHIVGIYFILTSEPYKLSEFIINNIKDGDIKNLNLKLDLLDTGYSFVDKRYLWLLPKKRYRLQLSTLKKRSCYKSANI